MRKLAVVAALAIFLSGSSPHFLFAQSNGSSVEGTVQDSSGAAIRDCEVTLLNTETGGRFNTQTDGAGLYVFPTIPPGLAAHSRRSTMQSGSRRSPPNQPC